MDINDGNRKDSWNQESRQIRRVALYGFLLNLSLTAMKALLALFSGSLAIIASTIDSATDSVASLVLYIGLKLSNKKTSTFPLGLYKIENLISVAMAFFIFFAGYEIARHAFSAAALPPDISLTTILLVLLGTIAIFLFGQYAVAAGRRTESPTLIAEGRHRQADVLASVVVLLSISISYLDLNLSIYGVTIDQIAAVVILLFIAHTGWELLSDGMRVLLDASIDHETLAEVQKIIESEPMVSEVNSLVGRNAGRFRYIQASVSMRTDKLEKAHQISERIETNIQDRVPHVERVMIHYEPRSRKYLRFAAPLSDLDDVEISSHFGDAPYFAVVRLTMDENQIDGQEILKNPYMDLEKGKGILAAEWLVEKNIDLMVLPGELNKGPGYVFSGAGVEILIVDAKNLQEAVNLVFEKKGRPGPPKSETASK
jgi:cation diffusion facilitator family transporter